MKSIMTVFSFVLFAHTALANDWKVTQHDGDFWLQNAKEVSIRYQITSVGGTPEFEEVIKIDKISPVIILKYFAGTSGTSFTIDEHWAVIYHPETKTFLGDYPYDSKKHSSEMNISDPVWSYSKGEIHITDEESFIDKVIKLKFKKETL